MSNATGWERFPLERPERADDLRPGAIEVTDVVVRRGARAVLDGLSARFEPGARHVVLGRSGSGKSTLLRLLNRLEEPERGEVRVGGMPAARIPVRVLRQGVALVFQAARPLPGSVGDNLAYPFGAWGLGRPEPGRLEAAAGWVGLEPGGLGRDAATLSGGEQQRLAIAMALECRPVFLVMDEPTAALDPESARELAGAIARLCDATGLATIAVCHQRSHAAWLGDRGLVIEAGRVIDEGPLDAVLERADARLWGEGEGRA